MPVSSLCLFWHFVFLNIKFVLNIQNICRNKVYLTDFGQNCTSEQRMDRLCPGSSFNTRKRLNLSVTEKNMTLTTFY